MKIETLEQLEALINLAIANKLELLEVDGIKIVKTKHEFPQTKMSAPPLRTLDEELFGDTYNLSGSQGNLND